MFILLFAVLLVYLVVDKIGQITSPEASTPVGFATGGYSIEYLAGTDKVDIIVHPGQRVPVLKYASSGDTLFQFYKLSNPNFNWLIASGGTGAGLSTIQFLEISPNAKPGVYEVTGLLLSQPLGGVRNIPIRVRIEN